MSFRTDQTMFVISVIISIFNGRYIGFPCLKTNNKIELFSFSVNMKRGTLGHFTFTFASTTNVGD